MSGKKNTDFSKFFKQDTTKGFGATAKPTNHVQGKSLQPANKPKKRGDK